MQGGRVPRVQAIILSQFHIKKGFKIIHVTQKQNYITETQFTIYSELILFREQLCDRLLVSEFMDHYYLIGMPSLSVNTQEKSVYDRAKYLYAVSVLVYRQLYWDQGLHEVYKQIVGKLAHFFKFVEESSNIIYMNSLPENKQYLRNQLSKAFTKINANQECVLSHFSNCFTIINLNRCPYQKDHKKIKKSHVPITYLSDQEIEDIQSEFGKRLLRYARIGDFNVRKICELMEDQQAVYRYYEKCMNMGIVFMTDMFAFENRYALTHNIHKYVGERKDADEEELQSICEEVALKKTGIPETQRVTPNLLLYLYFQLSRKSPLKKIVDSNLALFTNINILKWIRISQILGLIKRVEQKFGIEEYNYSENMHEFEFISEDKIRTHLQVKAMRSPMSSGLSATGVKEEWERVNSVFNAHIKNMDSVDEICVSLKMSRSVLLGLLNFSSQKSLKLYYVSE